MMGGVHEILVSAYTTRLISMCLKNVFLKRNPTRFRNVVIKSPQPGTVVRPTFFRPSFMRRPRFAFYYIIIYHAGQVNIYRLIFVPPPLSAVVKSTLSNRYYIFMYYTARPSRSIVVAAIPTTAGQFFSYLTRTIISLCI